MIVITDRIFFVKFLIPTFYDQELLYWDQVCHAAFAFCEICLNFFELK